MNRPLDGCTVVVTRPSAQAARFLGLAREAGADCIPLPTLAIEPLAVPPAVREAVLAAVWDWVVYTSANAVDGAVAALGRLPVARHVAAVGRATASALERHGAVVTLRPDSADSEGLLATPELGAVAQRRVLLVKGAGGRALLRDTLRARGATVAALEVYRRSTAPVDAPALERLRNILQSAPDRLAVAVTSTAVLEGLLRIVPPALVAALTAVPLVVPGARVAATARRHGWRGRIVTAATAEDAAMLAALCEHAAAGPPPAAC